MAAASGSLIMGLSSISNGISQANAIRGKSAFDRVNAATNARLAEEQADDALSRGNVEANRARQQGKKVVSAQRAAAAAQGISSTDGDIADLSAEAELNAELDATTIRTNAIREAYGYKQQALNARSQGEFAEMAAENQARNTVLTGGMQALGYGMEGLAKSEAAKEARKRAKEGR